VAEAEPGAARQKLVVVTDDTHVREAARFCFPSNVSVSFALDSRDASKLLDREIPSVVVVDMQTGSAGGYALAREMAETPRLANVPIVMLLEREQDAWLARIAGAAAHRVKPVVPDDLVETVARVAPPR
jgi:CheY-like chemotaxis protein